MNNYWDRYYKKKNGILKPSNFALYLKKKYLKKYTGLIYDVGCGNGRDTIFFNRNGINCIGLDQSKVAIKKNKISFKKYSKKFINKNFINFDFPKSQNLISIYSRFSIHSIKKKEEDIFLNKINKLKNLKFLFIEVRTIFDELYGKGKRIGLDQFKTTHYRRFINPIRLKKKILKNYKIIDYKLSRNLAKFKKENPKILRIVAKKK